MKVIAICNLPDGIKLDHAWFVAEDGLYAQKVAIRPLPQKYEYYDLNEQPEEILANYEARGWNACLSEITGEKE